MVFPKDRTHGSAFVKPTLVSPATIRETLNSGKLQSFLFSSRAHSTFTHSSSLPT
jgi:hypothetical protein